MPGVATTPDLVRDAYETAARRLAAVRARLGRPLTLAEKILYGHLDDPAGQTLEPGKGFLLLRPDRVALQDATAQMALLQCMQAGLRRVAVPATIHCDHLIRAQVGATRDLQDALSENDEVYRFLRSAARRFGLGFWKPGSGIIHQVVFEHYAFPGGLMIGTDSHTPNAGGLGMLAVGVGGADAVDVLTGFPWEVKHPTVVGVRLTGALRGWSAPKDVILRLCQILTVKGGTNRVVEYFGPGTASISATGKGTIANMGAELGATGSVFPWDDRMARYLDATGRADLSTLARRHADLLSADPETARDPGRFYEKVVEIDLTTLEPHVVGPHTPDLARPVSALPAEAAGKKYPASISACLVGSCTNSSYEDISRAADVARQAARRGVRVQVPLLVTPGSEQVRATIARDGQLEALTSIGATVLANACGPCIGQWKRTDIRKGDPNAIMTSYNRNFPERNDGSPATMAFIASPEVVMAYALSGRLDADPLHEAIATPAGPFRLEPPGTAPEVPPSGFVGAQGVYEDPPAKGADVPLEVAPDSERLQILAPFPAWDGRDPENLPVLLKARGKCTTDHISPAGPWLRFRGHLDRISDNLFLGAVNAYTGKAGCGTHPVTGAADVPFPRIARDLRDRGVRWVAVGDENYGEGSSREHAAMEPRHLGCAAVIARSFARIHESNLKKQGILPLTFADPADYDRVAPGDRISLHGLAGLAPGTPVGATIRHAAGGETRIRLAHTLHKEQIGWYRAGSALNALRPGGSPTKA